MSDPIFDVERRKKMSFDMEMEEWSDEQEIRENQHTIGPLYALSSTGKVKMWKAEVIKGDIALITYTFGYVDGKKQVQEKEITTGKNLGKSNETTPYEQACKDAESKADKKRDEGYQEDKHNLSVPILPMLAHPFDKRKHNILWPAAMQPKIDGVRCTATLEDKKVKMFTRKGKAFTIMNHIEMSLMLLLERSELSDFYIDGELYSDELTFQELAGAVRREDNDQETLDKIYYIIFDCFDLDNPEWTFRERWSYIKNLYKQYPKQSVELVPTLIVNTENDLRKKHDEYISTGYEGIMVRNAEGLYKLGYRSPDLQKLKSFVDSEYTIINYKEGEGSELGCVVWQCETGSGDRFWVRPMGTQEERKAYYDNGNKYLGAKLTVRYQELTDDGIPRFPVGVSIRDYE